MTAPSKIARCICQPSERFGHETFCDFYDEPLAPIRNPCLKCDGRGWFTHYDQAKEGYVRSDCDHRYTDEQMAEAWRNA